VCHQDTQFSLTESRILFSEKLSEIQTVTRLFVYSLSAWPVIQALTEELGTNPELAELIQSVVLLHPAKDPLHAVRIMDWIMRWWESEVQSREYFLHWPYEEVYNTLIDWWNWNWLQFQTDLQHEHTADVFDLCLQDLREQYAIQITQLLHPKDFVTNWEIPSENSRMNAAKAMAAHRPKLAWKDLFKLGL